MDQVRATGRSSVSAQAGVVLPVDRPHDRDAEWERTARRARALSWASLAWMTAEGVVGLIARRERRRPQRHRLGGVLVRRGPRVDDRDLAVHGLTAPVGRQRAHRSSGGRGSFLLLVPFFVYEAIRSLANGSDASSSALGIAITGSAIVLMPLLGAAKLRLGERLGSAATAGEGAQNLMCAAQAAAALIALIGASAGVSGSTRSQRWWWPRSRSRRASPCGRARTTR